VNGTRAANQTRDGRWKASSPLAARQGSGQTLPSVQNAPGDVSSTPDAMSERQPPPRSAAGACLAALLVLVDYIKGMYIRPSAVAGTFYESDPDRLTRQVDACFAANPPAPPRKERLARSAHAGLMYSGHVAAAFTRRGPAEAFRDPLSESAGAGHLPRSIARARGARRSARSRSTRRSRMR
jgi:hypothetical protein